MPAEKIMNNLESLVLSSNLLAEDYAGSLSCIIGRLGREKSLLLLAYQICSFIKGITDPLYQLVVLKI